MEQETITALRQQQDNLQACEIMRDTYKAAEKRLSTAPLPDEVAEASTWLREKCGGVGNKVADLIERLAQERLAFAIESEERRGRIEAKRIQEMK